MYLRIILFHTGSRIVCLGSPDHPPHVKNLVQSHSGPSKNNHSYAEAGSPASALFSSIKGGAGSLVKNIRDASTKVMDTVSA